MPILTPGNCSGWQQGVTPHLSDQPLSPAEARRLEQFAARREGREPLQYICGRWPFLNFELAVGPGVLCPRADTEVVAEAAAGQLKGVQNPRVLDLCAGTGCLGLGVKALRPDAEVTCLEKSSEALQYLRGKCPQRPWQVCRGRPSRQPGWWKGICSLTGRP